MTACSAKDCRKVATQSRQHPAARWEETIQVCDYHAGILDGVSTLFPAAYQPASRVVQNELLDWCEAHLVIGDNPKNYELACDLYDCLTTTWEGPDPVPSPKRLAWALAELGATSFRMSKGIRAWSNVCIRRAA
jgi:hypothetical protein